MSEMCTNHFSTTLMVLGLSFLVLGCGAQPSAFPPTAGDFVKNSGGKGSAQVWGIDFSIANPIGKTASSETEATLDSDPKKRMAKVTITVGDDIVIQLENELGSRMSLVLNDESYGHVAVGDQVSIDQDRNVTVNGVLRQSAQRVE